MSKPTTVQSLIFSSADFTVAQARKWAAEHGFESSKADATSGSVRLRQFDPDLFAPGSFRTIAFRPGVKAVIGKRRTATATKRPRHNLRLAAKSRRAYLPAAQVRAAVKPGWLVKAVFGDRERMWVKVTKVTKKGWEGELRNDPVDVEGKWGDRATGTWSEVLDYAKNTRSR